MVTAAVENWNDPRGISTLFQCEQQLALHPRRPHCGWRENYRKPRTAIQRAADFVMPLLRADNVLLAVPDVDAMRAQNCGEALDEPLIAAGMGEEDQWLAALFLHRPLLCSAAVSILATSRPALPGSRTSIRFKCCRIHGIRLAGVGFTMTGMKRPSNRSFPNAYS